MSVNTKVNGQLVKSAGLYSVTAPIGMADIYSTEEKEIGLWVDNKPLYQITYIFASTISFTADTWMDTGINVSNIDKFAYGAVQETSGTYAPVDTGKLQSGNLTFRSARGGTATRITIQYTKTTDTPWSGKFVPQGYGYVSSGDIYSFEERQIGVFADGKPLYQKTFDLGDIAQSSNAQVDITSLNIESVATIFGIGKDSSGNIIPIPFAHTVNTTSNVFCRYNSNGKLGVYTGAQSISDDTVVTIQYTKTTDVAGSGEYVPSGDKAVHYSTDEEVIGTWIDGSTIYRKTIHKVNTTVTNGTEIAHGISNLAMCTKLDVVCYDESGTSFPLMAIGSQYADNSSERSMGFRINATNFVAYGKNEFVAQTTRHWYFTVEYTKTS